jgi:hypothetical protein
MIWLFALLTMGMFMYGKKSYRKNIINVIIVQILVWLKTEHMSILKVSKKKIRFVLFLLTIMFIEITLIKLLDLHRNFS